MRCNTQHHLDITNERIALEKLAMQRTTKPITIFLIVVYCQEIYWNNS